MHTIHIITDKGAKPGIENVIAALPENLTGEVFLLQDTLNVGPLQKDGLSFTQVRTEFRNQLFEQAIALPIDDLNRLMELSTRLSNGETAQLCLWMAANATDVCAYFWLLHYLKKHQGKLSIINIAGLPFLNEENQLFYPYSIGQLPEKELTKALKLIRQISLSEWETDQEEWKRLREENTDLRILTEGKNLKSRPADYLDNILINLCKETNKRRSTILQQARQQNKFQIPDAFLQYRLRVLETNGSILT